MWHGLLGVLLLTPAMLVPAGGAIGGAASATTPDKEVSLPASSGHEKTFGFADRGLDQAAYSIYLYHTDRGKAEVSRVTADGADPAFSLLASAPATRTGSYRSSAYFMRKDFVYDPAVQGPIEGIDFLQNSYVTVETTGKLDQMGGHFNSVIEQNGQYFAHAVAFKPTVGAYVAGAVSSLHAEDYNLLTNLLTFATDPAVHPDFAGAPLHFGVKVGWSVSTEYPATKADIRVSRIEYRIHPKKPT